ncbi:hypothetical protein ACFL6I_04055 [candidate division KSB1 bacterium]
MQFIKSAKMIPTILLSAAALFTGCSDSTPPPEPITALPFNPVQFEPAEEWQNKTVLLEAFSGSECPPCAGVDLALDGLLEAYDRKYLAVLVYHIPIPGPDPMMTRASHFRAFYYDAYRAPMTFFDGEEKYRGGGREDIAEQQFDLYAEEINSRLYENPKIILDAGAVLENDVVTVNFGMNSVLENAEYNIVLAQKEVEYVGRNRILSHKMVVKHHETFEPGAERSGEMTIHVQDVEETGKNWLENVERNYAPYTFKEKRYAINRSQLAVVFFVQDKTTHKVYNAVFTDVVVKEGGTW